MKAKMLSELIEEAALATAWIEHTKDDVPQAFKRLSQFVTILAEQLILERARRYGPSSEKSEDRVFNEAEQSADIDAHGDDDGADTEDENGAASKTGTKKKRQTENNDNDNEPSKRGRKPLPEHLPRVRVIFDLPEGEKTCSCCDKPLHLIGSVVTEQFHVELKAMVLQNTRLKYGCRDCQNHGVTTPMFCAPMPKQPIPGGVPTPSTLAYVCTAKFADGLPLYRLEEAFARMGAGISRGTLARWVIRASEDGLLLRIYRAMKKELLTQGLIHGDETKVQVLKEDGRDAKTQSFMWVYRSGQHARNRLVLFEYEPGRGKRYPEAFLDGWRGGLLMSDGYSSWRAVKGAISLGCMAHARRKFHDALKVNKEADSLPNQALRLIRALYHVEKKAAQHKLGENETRASVTLAMRQENSVPILKELRAWLDQHEPKVLPDSVLSNAIRYTQNQWEFLERYASNGLAPIDNNIVERDIRKFVIGRNAWLFCDSVRGADAGAVLYSCMLTCRANNVEPNAWLVHVFSELPNRPLDADIDDLLPYNYARKQHAVAPDTS